jgi:hypothetical protein
MASPSGRLPARRRPFVVFAPLDVFAIGAHLPGARHFGAPARKHFPEKGIFHCHGKNQSR